jgi:Ca2+-binding EF-hand superfamily protein
MATEEFTIEEAFRFFDKDGSGSIDKHELVGGLRALGCNPTESEIEAIIEDADSKVQEDGRLQFSEFAELVEKYRKSRDEERETLVRAFRLFDRNGDGVIDKNELKQALTTLGFSKLTEEEVDELFAEADADDSGAIDFNELVRVILA